MSDPRPFADISTQFDLNMRSLRTFSEEIGKLAEEHDQVTAKQLSSSLSEAIGQDLMDLIKREKKTEQNWFSALTQGKMKMLRR